MRVAPCRQLSVRAAAGGLPARPAPAAGLPSTTTAAAAAVPRATRLPWATAGLRWVPAQPCNFQPQEVCSRRVLDHLLTSSLWHIGLFSYVLEALSLDNCCLSSSFLITERFCSVAVFRQSPFVMINLFLAYAEAYRACPKVGRRALAYSVVFMYVVSDLIFATYQAHSQK